MHREMFGVDGRNYGDACLVSGGPPAASRGIVESKSWDYVARIAGWQ